MPKFIKKRFLLLVVLVLFIVLKIPHLSYPFYWDESWPYASAVYNMHLNGASLLPGSISGELSRGHPLMFHFLAAIWMNIFGTSHFALHCFALLIAILFLIVIYEVALRLFDAKTAVVALLLIAFQQIYILQSSFLLLEVLLALTGFLIVYFYITKKYLLVGILFTVLYYTKESGAILGFVLGIDALISLFSKQESVKSKVFKILSLAVPVVLIATFFVAQKKIVGWYVLPENVNELERTWASYSYKIKACAEVYFTNDLRWYIFTVVIALSLIAAFIKKNVRYVSPVLMLPIAYLLTNYTLDIIPGYILLLLMGGALLVIAYSLFSLSGFNTPVQKRFVMLNICFIICFTAFSAINRLVIDRYLLITLVPLLFITAMYLRVIIFAIHKALFLPILVLLLLTEAYIYYDDTVQGDKFIGAFDGMEVHQGLVNYLETHQYYNKHISAGAYLERTHLTDPYSGFLAGSRTFEKVEWYIKPETDYVVFDNIEGDNRYNDLKQDKRFTLVYRISKGMAWGEIYEQQH